MLIPSPPMFLPKQRYAGRFWDTDDVMELLSIYYGARRAIYPVTWQYRTLISIQRAQDATNAYRKGYGPDWKSLKKKEVGGVVHWVPDNGFAIKSDLLEYGRQGRVPFKALQLAAVEIRKVEFERWVASRIEHRADERQPIPIAAE